MAHAMQSTYSICNNQLHGSLPRPPSKRLKAAFNTSSPTSSTTHRRTTLTVTRASETTSSSNNRNDSETTPQVPKVGWLWDRKSTSAPSKMLRQQNIRPKKTLGQHFLFDERVLVAVADAAKLTSSDCVLEIGPGPGGLTRQLLAKGAAVTAVEKDYGLHDKLAEEYANDSNLTLVCGDVMRLNIPQLLQDMLDKNNNSDASNTSKVKVVANLPYNITKECLVAMLPLSSHVASLVLMLQDEVAIRLTNKQPGGQDWRAMNIIVQYYSDAKYLFKVDRKRYTPPPQVHGAVVEFRLLSPEERKPVPDEKFFIKLVKTSFLQRRKLLKNSLAVLFGGGETVEQALSKAGLPTDARAQILGLQEFVDLSWALHELQQ